MSNDQLVLYVQVLNQGVNSQGDSRNELLGKLDAEPELSHKKCRLLLYIDSYT